jgi:hypothetical protein
MVLVPLCSSLEA